MFLFKLNKGVYLFAGYGKKKKKDREILDEQTN